MQLIENGATHIGVATDHVIESFRNDLWPGYKTSEGMEPEILRQIPVLEDALRAMGVTVWAMTEFEADDALASAVRVACEDRRVHQVRLLTPDKDLGQCVSGRRVVQVDRKNDTTIDEDCVRAKFGIGPESIVDYLALVGDSADGFPGLSGWGAKSASTLLSKYGDIMSIPQDHAQWASDGVKVRGAERLAKTLRDGRTDVELYRILATLIDTVDVGSVDEWLCGSHRPDCARVLAEIGATGIWERMLRSSLKEL
jgi:5'-3' exonuclease